MKFPRTGRILIAALLGLAVALPAIGLAGKGGKPGGGNEEPPPNDPGVRFQIAYFISPNPDHYVFSIRDVNQVGQIVGYFGADDVANILHAFLYDIRWGTGQAVDLNEITVGIPEGHFIRSATGINAAGQISVYLDDDTVEGLQRSAGMVDLNHIGPDGLPLPKLYIVPNPENRQFIAAGINDQGDLLGYELPENGPRPLWMYNFGIADENLFTPEVIDLGVSTNSSISIPINNRTPDRGPQIVGANAEYIPFRLTVGGAYEEFPNYIDADGNLIEQHAATGLNNLGEFCGRVRVNYPKKIRTSLYHYESYIQGATIERFMDPGPNDSAVSINDSSDYVTRSGLVQHRQLGHFFVTDWLDPNDPDSATFNEADLYEAKLIGDRNDSGFPTIIGHQTVTTGIGRGFILIPVSTL